MKRKAALFLASVLAIGAFGGCGKKQGGEDVKLGNMNINFGDYKDCDDIPDWDGEKIKLSVWQDANSPNAYARFETSKDDVVAPEIERITGVSFDSENSFDNAGSSFDAKITQITASKDYPDIGISIPSLSSLVESDALWDLTDYVKKYCPNIMKMMGPDTCFKTVWEGQQKSLGGLYALAIGESEGLVRNMVEDGTYSMTEEQITALAGRGLSPYGYVYVRDDILKKIYPEAHTAAELEEIYNEKGAFTKEEIFDVPLNSTQDYMDMLYKIQALNLTDDEGKVYTSYAFDGNDSWNALTDGGAIFGYACDYFNYIDLETGKAAYTYEQPWFKDVLKSYNKLIKDGIIPQENLLDTAQKHKEKLSNARYAVSTSVNEPDVTGLNGKYKYRKVYMKFDRKYDKFLTAGGGADGLRKISFFKKSVSESELIQALRAFDFIASLPGQKLTYWGPKSAGLYTEQEDGTLQYNDDKLREQMLNSGANGDDLIEKYGLRDGAWPGHPYVHASPYNPKAFYANDVKWDAAFNPTYLEGVSIFTPQGADTHIYSEHYTSKIPGAKKLWNSRKTFEDALVQVMAATNDSDLDKRYNELVDLAKSNGFNDETLDGFEKLFNEENEPYKSEQEKFREELKNRTPLW